MPLIRFTTPKDVAAHGDDPVHVHENTAARMVSMRRAVRVDEAELAKLTKPELAEIAKEAGAEVNPRDSKGHFVKAIAESEKP